MRDYLHAVIFVLALNFPLNSYGAPGRTAGPSDPGGALKEYSIASFGGSGQNSIQSIATDSSGNIYVAGTTSSPDFPVQNAAQPTFGDSRIMRTTDLGTTWTRVGSPPQDVNVVVPDPVTPQVLFAGGDAGIYKSTDAGQTWRLVYGFKLGFSFNGALVMDPGNHLRLAATVPFSGQVIRSLDGGETWTTVVAPCGISRCAGKLVVDPSGSGALLISANGLYLSRDWGASFQALRPAGIGSLSAVAFDPSRPGWIYAGTAAGVLGSFFVSTDFGATWMAKASPLTTFSLILNLTVDPDQPDTLVAATPDGFWRSTDGASSWTRQGGHFGSFSPEGNFPFAILSHRCAPAGGLFALGSGGAGSFQVGFSPDYGATWTGARLTHVSSVTAGPGCAVYITRQGTSDAFVAKLTADGHKLWATFLGGSDQDVPVALVVDAEGNAYITGNTNSPDFPATVPRIGVPRENAVFVTKFSPEGKLVYSAVIGGDTRNTASAMAVDQGQSVYVVGTTGSGDFPVSPGALHTTLEPGSFAGFLLKLSPDAALEYATFLGGAYVFARALLVDAAGETIIAGTGQVPGLPSPDNPPAFVMKLDSTASRVVSATYIEGASRGEAAGPTALATDAEGNLLVLGGTGSGPNFATTPGAFNFQALAKCTRFVYENGPEGDVFIAKLAAADWTPIYRARIAAQCGIQPGAMAVDRTGAVVFAVATGGGFPLHNPLLGGPACSSYFTSAVAKLSRDGSTLEFGTYLDDCGVPGIALAGDGSLYAGVSYGLFGSLAGVMHLGTASTRSLSLDRIANAFSEDAAAVARGGLYSLTGIGFQLPAVDLGLNPKQDLPTQLGGIEVKFDGVSASILQTSPGRVMVAAPWDLPAPSHLPGRRRELRRNGSSPDLTAVQIFYNGVPSNTVWMPVVASLPGLLTRDYPNPQLHSDFADGIVRNADGTPNDEDHPAAAGSTITLFATGLGVTNPVVVPGSIADSTSVVPVAGVYASWNRDLNPDVVTSVPGSVSALFQIHLQVPNPIPNSGGTPSSSGVQRGFVGLSLRSEAFRYFPPASNFVAVYVK